MLEEVKRTTRLVWYYLKQEYVCVVELLLETFKLAL